MPVSTADIERAAARRRAAIQRQEEEAGLDIGKARVKKISAGREEKKARWKRPPNFRVPSSPVGRPKSSTGGVTFHFQLRSVSKTGTPKSNGTAMKTTAFKVNLGAAVAHAKYIERDAAPERLLTARIVHEPGQERAPERSNDNAEEPDNDEKTVLGSTIEVANGGELIWSNIADDPFLRAEYWAAVERTERTPRTHSLEFDRDIPAEIWSDLINIDTVPSQLRAHLARELLSIENAERNSQSYQISPLSVDEEQAGAILKWAEGQDFWSNTAPPITFKSGRGGRTQYRLIAELPHELDTEGRAEIVSRFARELGELGVMYTAVVHAPDAHNDDRNYHLHLIFHDRPAKYLDEHACWDFEFAEIKTKTGGRDQRVTFPKRRPKVDAVAQDKKFPERLRKRFSEISNEVLSAAGVPKRYDPRSYKAMGIEKTPTIHLGTNAAALEAIGVPTTPGALNAYAAWKDLERTIEKKKDALIRQDHQTTKGIYAQIRASTASDEDKDKAIQLAGRRPVISQQATELWAHLELMELLAAQARSRALRTRDTTARMIAQINSRTADSYTKKSRVLIEQRYAEAHAHIKKLDETFAQDEPLLAQIREDREIFLRQVKLIDAQIQTLLRRQTPATIVPMTKRERDLQVTPTATPAPQISKPASLPAATRPAATQPISNPAPNAPSRTTKETTHEKPTVRRRPTRTPRDLLWTTLPAPEQYSRGDIGRDPAGPPPGMRIMPSSFLVSLPVDAQLLLLNVSHSDMGRGAGANHQLRWTGIGDRENASRIAGQPSEAALARAREAAAKLEARAAAEKARADEAARVAPTLPLDLAPQPAPTKPGSRQDIEKRWTELIDRIAKERILVEASASQPGVWHVPSLSAEDAAILMEPRLRARTQPRLAGIQKQQRLEIGRCKAWLQSIAGEYSRFPSESGTINIKNAPRPIHTLLNHYRGNPELTATRDAILAERRAFAATTTSQESSPGVDAVIQRIEREQAAKLAKGDRPMSHEERMRERYARAAEQNKKLYPPPKTIRDPIIRELVDALYVGRPDDELAPIADRIVDDRDASADMYNHGPNLSGLILALSTPKSVRAARERDGFWTIHEGRRDGGRNA